MNGVAGLAKYIADVVKNAKKEGNGAVKGIISGGYVRVMNNSYPFTAAVDVNTNDGDYVWCIITKDKTAVIVGA